MAKKQRIALGIFQCKIFFDLFEKYRHFRNATRPIVREFSVRFTLIFAVARALLISLWLDVLDFLQIPMRGNSFDLAKSILSAPSSCSL
jgi:hypothetical protein